ncbi:MULTISPECIES: DUF2750 domain-containing protein [Pseudoalteromonas]|jgi:hypothetical protein|uniref:DUF2750 domain-containing protein n=3 Tax=Pseudoalteromonas TaxID=53246 RepID=A0AAD0U0K5_9GAMM|nr:MULTISPECIES: DUF2750 domain-containing protein [Pseudoalteromonas]MAJ41251.1 DUF2750 domain-containing protein [Pseudoalteromonadaceae bacterium]MCP4057218.1 DUF2750 domain-containing protein [Pseudoalteromonas sp.]MDC9520007.1 DUF2750 domain-containing protein [Pseudoalteromonas sp. Angola-31]MDY6887433.1 DUF2750 domain-containing protein [Pseudomonadota bacterium]OUX83476.1 MAG: DUF2750 domain-containing protein [Pseudoalteromonas sp. TMED43]|tara:strand:+ start:1749 stop:2099 length:351 start_codon:yes stop_codon:yes gene_type:complete
MSDIEIESQLVSFVEKVRLSEQVWALGGDDGGFVVCESNQFAETDVLLLWESEDAAKAQCKEEWQEFTPVEINLDEFLDEWVEDLNEDSALVGLNWNDDQVCVEIEPVGLARALSE